jgi:hypothetical protein
VQASQSLLSTGKFLSFQRSTAVSASMMSRPARWWRSGRSRGERTAVRACRGRGGCRCWGRPAIPSRDELLQSCEVKLCARCLRAYGVRYAIRVWRCKHRADGMQKKVKIVKILLPFVTN